MDTNIPIYAAGRDHPSKNACAKWILETAEGRHHAVTDSEVLQEILYRYWHIRDLARGQALFDHFVTVVPAVFPIAKQDAVRANQLLKAHSGIEPRDAIHAAVMLNHGVEWIVSYDRHFDEIPGIRRMEP